MRVHHIAESILDEMGLRGGGGDSPPYPYVEKNLDGGYTCIRSDKMLVGYVDVHRHCK